MVGYVDVDARRAAWSTPPPSAAGGRGAGPATCKRMLPNYGVFDEQRWFTPGTGPCDLLPGGRGAGRASPSARTCGSPAGRWPTRPAPGPAWWSTSTPRPTRGAAAAERLAVLADRVGRDGLRHRLREPGRRPGRAGLRRGVAWWSAPTAPWWPRPPSSSRRCWSRPRVPADPGPPGTGAGAVDRHPAAGAAGRPPAPPVARPGGRGLRGAGARDPRLPGQERLHRRRDRAVGRDRLVAGGGGGRRRRRARARPRGGHAVAVLERGVGRPTPTALAANLGIDLATRARSSRPTGPWPTRWPRCWAASPTGLTDENLQRRIRGVLLMALSNAHGWIVLTTGNKSEMATGYSTLYGDSAGGFAVIKDVAKTLVYELCRYRNARAGRRARSPRPVLTKAPSAELRPDQRDDESLPPYEVLDPVMAGYVEGDRSADDLVADGFDPEAVARVVAPGRPGRVQAAPDAARGPDLGQGVRQGSAHADHQPLPLRGARVAPPLRRAAVRCLTADRTPPSTVARRRPGPAPLPLGTDGRAGRRVPLDRDGALRAARAPGSPTCPLAGVQVHLDAPEHPRTPGTPSCGPTGCRCWPGSTPTALTRPLSRPRGAARRPRRRRAAGGRARVDLAARGRGGAPPGGPAPAGRALPGGAAPAGDHLQPPPAVAVAGGRRPAASGPSAWCCATRSRTGWPGSAWSSAWSPGPTTWPPSTRSSSASSRWRWRPVRTRAW